MIPPSEGANRSEDFEMERKLVRSGALARRLGAALLAVTALLALQAAPAAALGGGQIGESFGTPGVGNGQFFNPLMFGADPVDGTLYAGDYNGTVEATEATDFRIQQFSASGEFKASTTVKRFPEAGKIRGLQGIAVDHSLGRFYAVESCRVSVSLIIKMSTCFSVSRKSALVRSIQ